MFGNNNTENLAHTTKDSPTYPIGPDLLKTIVVAAALIVLTIGSMVLMRNTAPARWVLMMYDIAAILGVIVMGGLLTAGRYLGLKGVGTNDLPLAVVGSLLSIIAYGLFGAAILTRYPTGIHIPAILVTAGITLAITLAAAVYVYTTDSSQEKWASYSGTLFIVGIVAVAIGYVASPFLWVGFFAFLLGFICDLVYEIWMVSSSRRTPMANGFAIYIAFAGVFVHILQLVLRAMAKD